MLLDNFEGCVEPTPGQSVVLRQLQPRLQPELRFAARVLDVDVGPWLFELPITPLSALWQFYTGPVHGGRVLWPGSAKGSRGGAVGPPDQDMAEKAG